MTKHWIIPDWPVPENIHCASTLRTGGVSTGEYSSLNLADHVGDKPGWVVENRKRIAERLHLPTEPLWLEQVHGNHVINTFDPRVPPKADASYTDRPGVVCAVLTADCLPILICNQKGSFVAAIHAGWRGLLAGVIENAVNSIPDRELLVWLGPAIGPGCFEVGSEVAQMFAEKSVAFAAAFQQQRNGKSFADIYQIARIILSGLGIERVYGGGFCTVTEAERFFSYRREGQTGRMATLIWRD